MRVFIVRHGESEGNRTDVHDSPTTPLSELGIKQAKTVAERLSEANPEIIICSRYVRAVQTAKVMAKVLGKKIIYTPLLNEWKLASELHSTKFDGEEAAAIRSTMEKFADNPDWHYSDEENAFEIIARAQKAIEYIAARKEKTIVVVSHGSFIKAILQSAIFGPDIRATEFHRINHLFRTTNTGITELEMEKGAITRILKFNDSGHLK